MRRNIDVLKAMANEIKDYKVADDNLEVFMELEEDTIEDVYDNDKEYLLAVYKPLKNISKYVSELTEDLKATISKMSQMVSEDNYLDFDCFEWIVSKIEQSEIEIINYIETFDDLMDSLGLVIDAILYNYKIYTQAAYDGGEVDG